MMKKLLTVVTLAVLAAACDVQPDTQQTSGAATAAALVGTWSGPKLTVALLANGAYVLVPQDGSGFTSGTWVVSATGLDLFGGGGQGGYPYTLSGDTLSVTLGSTYGTVALSRTQKYCTWSGNVCQ